jgi:hypothetical protein
MDLGSIIGLFVLLFCLVISAWCMLQSQVSDTRKMLKKHAEFHADKGDRDKGLNEMLDADE